MAGRANGGRNSDKLWGLTSGCPSKRWVKFRKRGTQSSFVKSSGGKDDLAGGIDEHKVWNTMVGKRPEYVRGGMEIRPRLVMLAPECISFFWIFVFIDAEQDQPICNGFVVQLFDRRK